MKRKALFVGVNEYEDAQIRDLNYSLSDAHALKTLFELFGYETDILENPAKSDVFSAVKKMTGDLSAGDLFFFYFAGHGWTTTSGKHLLFCKDDMYEDLRDEDAGISFNKLKRKTTGVYNRAFVLDACRSDFITGTRGDDTTTRDLRPIGELVKDAPTTSSLAVLRSCSKYEHALEIESRKHGLFTLAMMDVLRASKESGAELLFGESLCDAVTQKMADIARAEGIVAEQTPEFAKSGIAQVLVSGRTVPPPQYQQPAATPTLVLCPSCGFRNREEQTFRCRICKRDYLCKSHYDETEKCCEDCAAAKRAASNQVVCPICGSRNLSAYTFTCRVCGKSHLCQRHYDEVENCCMECAAAKRKKREEAMRTAREEVRRKAHEEPESKESVHVAPSQLQLNAGTVKKLTLPGGAEMEMIYCPPGTFWMGSENGEDGHQSDETFHRVTLTKGFWLGKYPVTQGQWKSVMGSNPSRFTGGDALPVENVSWDDCQDFIAKVNAALGCGARLPTEAEWEYACRAGTTTAYSWGNALNGDNANCNGNYPCGPKAKGPYLDKTAPVGQYAPNPWGFCDMHGNVYDWCNDWYGGYPSGDVTDPVGPASGMKRVLRGGCWLSLARDCRSAHRAGRKPGDRYDRYGFRLCCWDDQCLSHGSADYRCEACVDRETVERLFQDKYNFLKGGPYKEIGKPNLGGLQKNPDGGWRCTYGATWDKSGGVWAAITICPGDDKEHETHGAICHRWWHQEGGPSGSLGYPISDEEVYGHPKSEDRISHFERGDVVWRKAKMRTPDETFVIKKVLLWAGGPCWADRNIGAENPWESGYYFWWGDTVGYKFEDGNWVASDSSSRGGSGHDAAQVQWGGGWRMPTQQELRDLCDKCDWNWTTVHGINGYIVRGRGGYASNSIFLPCAGSGYGTSLCNVSSRALLTVRPEHGRPHLVLPLLPFERPRHEQQLPLLRAVCSSSPRATN